MLTPGRALSCVRRTSPATLHWLHASVTPALVPRNACSQSYPRGCLMLPYAWFLSCRMVAMTLAPRYLCGNKAVGVRDQQQEARRDFAFGRHGRELDNLA